MTVIFNQKKGLGMIEIPELECFLERDGSNEKSIILVECDQKAQKSVWGLSFVCDD